jgi:hypothetical protein
MGPLARRSRKLRENIKENLVLEEDLPNKYILKELLNNNQDGSIPFLVFLENTEQLFFENQALKRRIEILEQQNIKNIKNESIEEEKEENIVPITKYFQRIEKKVVQEIQEEDIIDPIDKEIENNAQKIEDLASYVKTLLEKNLGK